MKAGEQYLPYMTWSAGQREFMPLLLGLYWLMPPSFKFDDDRVRVEDISDLNPGDENDDESDWGGLTQFSSRVSNIVSSLVGESM